MLLDYTLLLCAIALQLVVDESSSGEEDFLSLSHQEVQNLHQYLHYVVRRTENEYCPKQEAWNFVTDQSQVHQNEEAIHLLHDFSLATWKLEEIHAS